MIEVKLIHGKPHIFEGPQFGWNSNQTVVMVLKTLPSPIEVTAPDGSKVTATTRPVFMAPWSQVLYIEELVDDLAESNKIQIVTEIPTGLLEQIKKGPPSEN